MKPDLFFEKENSPRMNEGEETGGEGTAVCHRNSVMEGQLSATPTGQQLPITGRCEGVYIAIYVA